VDEVGGGKRETASIRDCSVRACNACGSEGAERFGPANGLELVRCERCRLVYTALRPDPRDVATLYDESYFRNATSGVVGYADYIGDEANLRRTFARRLRRLERFVHPGRLLDVGCASGFFLDEARKRGWRVEGLDVSPYAAEYTRRRFGAVVHEVDLAGLASPGGVYDLLTMWDVIEHVPDPLGCLRAASSVLRKGGILALATPDVDSVPARVMDGRWIGYKLSREHLYYFSRGTLHRMLAETGFEVLETRYVGKFVSVGFFLERLGSYAVAPAKVLGWLARRFGATNQTLYVNPFDILGVTARRR
jgi:2-polyprenyl-3-methyl-5-hydroxy-6-metoxy-1,4-benzoquinol methylase